MHAYLGCKLILRQPQMHADLFYTFSVHTLPPIDARIGNTNTIASSLNCHIYKDNSHLWIKQFISNPLIISLDSFEVIAYFIGKQLLHFFHKKTRPSNSAKRHQARSATKEAAMPNLPPPTTSSKSKAVLAETRRLMAARRRPGIQTLADHQALRAFHKTRSRDLVEDAREKRLARQNRSRRERRVA